MYFARTSSPPATMLQSSASAPSLVLTQTRAEREKREVRRGREGRETVE